MKASASRRNASPCRARGRRASDRTSVLSGSHLPLVSEVLRQMREAGIGGIPVVVGGIVPQEDVSRLKAAGVARVYTPKDYDITRIMGETGRPHQIPASRKRPEPRLSAFKPQLIRVFGLTAG